MVLSEEEEGQIPKIIANAPVVVQDPRRPESRYWVLPYWREQPRGRTNCRTASDDFAGTLRSTGKGDWQAWGRTEFSRKIKMSKPDWLIEGTVVQLRNGTLMQLYRTSRNVTYKTLSHNAGQSWTAPAPTALPNANSKSHAIRLSNGAIVMAMNHHGFVEKIRSNLWIMISGDDGETWETLAQLESKFVRERRFHYPTLKQVGCELYCVYSVSGRGIKLARIPLEFTDDWTLDSEDSSEDSSEGSSEGSSEDSSEDSSEED